MTTEVPVSAADIARTIKAAPHCRLLLEPAGYHQRFVTLRDLRHAVETATIDMHGRVFPQSMDGSFGGSHRLPAGCEAWSRMKYLEAWRAFKSGQFIYYSSLDPVGSPGPAKYVRLFDPAWFASAFTHFGARFTERADFSSGLRLQLSLHGIGGRTLASHDLMETYHAETDFAHGQLALSASQLAADPEECAATLLGDILTVFRFEPSLAWLCGLLPRPTSGSEPAA